MVPSRFACTSRLSGVTVLYPPVRVGPSRTGSLWPLVRRICAGIVSGYFHTFGISNVYVKYVAGYVASKDYQRANSLLSTGLIVTSCLCLLLFALLCLEWSWIVTWVEISPHLANDAREVVFLIVSIFLMSLAFSAFGDALTGAQQLATVQKIWVVAYVVEAVLIFTLVGFGRGIRGMAEAFVVRTVIEISLSAWIAFRRLSWLRISPALCSREALRRLISFGGTVQLLGFLAIILNSIERTLAASLAGLWAAGIVDLSKKLPSMASLVPSAFLSSCAGRVVLTEWADGTRGRRAEGNEAPLPQRLTLYESVNGAGDRRVGRCACGHPALLAGEESSWRRLASDAVCRVYSYSFADGTGNRYSQGSWPTPGGVFLRRS